MVCFFLVASSGMCQFWRLWLCLQLPRGLNSKWGLDLRVSVFHTFPLLSLPYLFSLFPSLPFLVLSPNEEEMLFVASGVGGAMELQCIKWNKKRRRRKGGSCMLEKEEKKVKLAVAARRRKKRKKKKKNEEINKEEGGEKKSCYHDL